MKKSVLVCLSQIFHGHSCAKIQFVAHLKFTSDWAAFFCVGFLCYTPRLYAWARDLPVVMSPPTYLPLQVTHLSAGAHWGKGIGATYEQLPASDDQDPHIILTLLLKQ
jgi:hypothetical protein